MSDAAKPPSTPPNATHAAGAPAAKGKKKKKGDTITLGTRIAAAMRERRKDLSELVASLRSPDVRTRRMTYVFFVSAFMAFSVGVIGSVQALREYSAQKAIAKQADADRLGDFLEKQKEVAHKKNSVLELGEFTLEIIQSPDQPKVRGVTNMATLSITIQCDNRDTRAYIEKNLTVVKNQIINALVPIEREELMSRDGKRRLRQNMVNRINAFLPAGQKVENLYFTSLMIN